MRLERRQPAGFVEAYEPRVADRIGRKFRDARSICSRIGQEVTCLL
jgi:hypothetical protein